MNYQKYDLGNRSGGEIVVVTLQGNAANVRLMDSTNFNKFRRGGQHKYFGGYATKSPVKLSIPRSGHWHVVVDLGGHSGRVKSSVQVLPGALPSIRHTPLSSIPSLTRDADQLASEIEDGRVFDVFISHASEDKDEVVRPLANALKDGGLEVWYDEFELKIGDSLRRKIDKGLASSRFGIVVLSASFFSKGWTTYELDGLVTRTVTGEQILLPIWHNVSKQEVTSYSPSLADKLARSTAMHTVEEIAAEIIAVITES